MAELNFPSQGNTVGDTLEDPVSGRTWIWDGSKWELRAKPVDISFERREPVTLTETSSGGTNTVTYGFDIGTLSPLNDN